MGDSRVNGRAAISWIGPWVQWHPLRLVKSSSQRDLTDFREVLASDKIGLRSAELVRI